MKDSWREAVRVVALVGVDGVRSENLQDTATRKSVLELHHTKTTKMTKGQRPFTTALTTHGP